MRWLDSGSYNSNIAILSNKITAGSSDDLLKRAQAVATQPMLRQPNLLNGNPTQIAASSQLILQ